MTDTRQALAALVDVCDVNKHVPYRVYHAALENARAALSAQPVAGAVAHTSERHFALREAHCIKAQDDYFAARPVEDGAMSRRAFDAGFVRGFDAGEKVYAAPQPQAAPAPEPSAQGEPVAWRYSVQPQVLGPSYWALSETKDVPEAQPLYASAPSTPPPQPSAQGEPVEMQQSEREQWRKAVDGIGLLRTFLCGWKQSEHCKSNGMESEVQGWMDGISELYRLYDAAPSTPPPAVVEDVPLTDEQVQRAWQDQGGVARPGWIYSFARAIERAHGIAPKAAQPVEGER